MEKTWIYRVQTDMFEHETAFWLFLILCGLFIVIMLIRSTNGSRFDLTFSGSENAGLGHLLMLAGIVAALYFGSTGQPSYAFLGLAVFLGFLMGSQTRPPSGS